MGLPVTSLGGSFAAAIDGIEKAASMVQQAASKIASASSPAGGSDILDLSAAMVALMEGRNAFAANVKAAQSQDDLKRSLLNLLG